MSASDADAPGAEFQQDVAVDKPGIVGARWWHQGLKEDDRSMSRRQALVGIAVAGGVVAAVSALGVGISALTRPEATALGVRDALPLQKTYGWDFGARGVPLVFNGIAEGPFVRANLSALTEVMTPNPGPNTKYYVPTLVQSLMAQPSDVLPDPQDGLPRPDGAAPFRRLADVIVPVVTPEMGQAYAAGEAVARLARGRQDVAVLADLPGHQSVAFAAGATSRFEPVLLLDNWPHPHGVVPSHMTLAALAYYQPRFASQKVVGAPPLFVLDRMRLLAYSEESDRFDNRYYARMPNLQTLAKDGVRTLLYVVSSPAALPEPDDLNPILANPPTEPRFQVRAVSLTDFRSDRSGFDTEGLRYGGSADNEATFWEGGGSSATSDHQFLFRQTGGAIAASKVGKVAVVATASGLILAAALDRRGSMNRFAGGWSG